MKCRYISQNSYCRHKKHRQIGDTPMKCRVEGCHYCEEARLE